jgi:NO-binding membrane sensor protein with MHYT domain/GGDEF domain-containing protein
MSGYYNLPLVILSFVVAVLASYTTLELAARVSQRRGPGAWTWLCMGALSMGCGIWSMHFIGMLAFHLPVPVAYDGALTLLSMLIAVAVSGVALFLTGRPRLEGRNITGGATAMGIGISAMHYTGMHAMQMWPAIQYDHMLFVASVLIALMASFAALSIAFRLRHQDFGMAVLAKLGSATVMGLAITGMHYTAMAAAQFAPGSVCLALDSTLRMEAGALAVIVGGASIGILAITLGISAFDSHVSARTARLAQSLQAANEQLRNLAHYDTLTGLPNRMLLEDRLQQAAARAVRERRSLALLFGDELLRTVAQRMRTCVRNSDTVARTGGDEFVVVLCDIEQAQDAALVSRKLIDELSRLFVLGGHEILISCSIGISIYPQDGADLATLQSNADAAMYRAKQEGRSTYRFFAPGAAAPG